MNITASCREAGQGSCRYKNQVVCFFRQKYKEFNRDDKRTKKTKTKEEIQRRRQWFDSSPVEVKGQIPDEDSKVNQPWMLQGPTPGLQPSLIPQIGSITSVYRHSHRETLSLLCPLLTWGDSQRIPPLEAFHLHMDEEEISFPAFRLFWK